MVGLYIIWITVSLFTDYGKGTPAPYSPPKILVAIGDIQICAQPNDDRGLVCSDWRGKFIYVRWDIDMVFNIFHREHSFCHTMGGERFGNQIWRTLL